MLPDYKENVFCPLKLRHAHIIPVQFTITDGSGTPLVDTTQSAPRVTVVRNSAGQYTVTIDKGQFGHYLGGDVMLAEAVGNAVYLESYNPLTGVATIETAVNTAAATAADPASGARVFLTFLVGRA